MVYSSWASEKLDVPGAWCWRNCSHFRSLLRGHFETRKEYAFHLQYLHKHLLLTKFKIMLFCKKKNAPIFAEQKMNGKFEVERQ
jgi:hypothetical protein